jgi:hypothetical protein
MVDLKKPNAHLYLYLKAVEGAKGIDVSKAFLKCFNESQYSPQYALSLVCLRLQGDCITIGSKKYASPEELTQEKDGSQINLIKKALMETDSTLLVWLSFIYKDKLPSAKTFNQQPVTEKFFCWVYFPIFHSRISTQIGNKTP